MSQNELTSEPTVPELTAPEPTASAATTAPSEPTEAQRQHK